ncbi:MAG TPA: tetratricopeptide repeat protein [Bradyrhizobium sp.]|uniref:tetratricopeptide repeat protein n=1 Tax=Bradyrhizobium sp. TaxID=376 RepID=UPI002D80ED43|nr:tetratricopeptide repeat protein [Bradyrhizobium sp.]HET7885953.1 tetratricopeptide repeat protein [Bradyrhizobium sp.]
MGALQDGHLEKAEKLFTAILEYCPDHFDTLHLLGYVKLQRGKNLEAVGFLAKAVKANAGSLDAASNLGLALHNAGQFAEAIAQYRNALALSPRHPEILYNLGNAFLALDRITEALASYDEALVHNPSHVGARVNRGNTLLRFNRPADALESYEQALALMPEHPQILTNRGHALRRLDRPQEALASLAAAIGKSPDFPEAHFELALAHLTLGDFGAGWKAYEWRWKTNAFADKRRSFRQPQWLGDVSLAGKTVLLHAEQGFGDTLQFIRYAPLVASRGARVICEVQGELTSLLSQFENLEIVAKGGALPPFDLHCPLMSLPFAFGTELASVPAQMSYLKAPADRLAHWRERLGEGGPRVGFVWSGSSAHKNDANRSIPLAKLSRLLAELPLRCVSLQRELREADRESLRGLPDVIDLGPELADFSDTAAVISLLDVVVSVDTAVAHLAGSLGKPVVILLPHAADFRWLRGRDDTPWYPSAKLLRQSAFGDWDGVIARLAGELSGRAG